MRTKGKVNIIAPPVCNIYTMEISYNGATENIPQTFLADLLGIKGIADKQGIAVAVNQQVIPRSNWSNYTLNDKDSILVIKATQGG